MGSKAIPQWFLNLQAAGKAASRSAAETRRDASHQRRRTRRAGAADRGPRTALRQVAGAKPDVGSRSLSRQSTPLSGLERGVIPGKAGEW